MKAKDKELGKSGTLSLASAEASEDFMGIWAPLVSLGSRMGQSAVNMTAAQPWGVQSRAQNFRQSENDC